MDIARRDLKPEHTRQLCHDLALRNPLVAFWIAGLARLELDAEILQGARRLVAAECGRA